jgi:hypothetical protein
MYITIMASKSCDVCHLMPEGLYEYSCDTLWAVYLHHACTYFTNIHRMLYGYTPTCVDGQYASSQYPKLATPYAAMYYTCQSVRGVEHTLHQHSAHVRICTSNPARNAGIGVILVHVTELSI